MAKVCDVLKVLDDFAPVYSKLDFDNVGLLAGWNGAPVTRVLLALDITMPVILEAEELGAELIVSHHPLTFGLKTVTDATPEGARFAALLRRGISAICMHTNLDAAPGGVNDALAAGCGLQVQALLGQDGVYKDGTPHSTGRICKAAGQSVREFASHVKSSLGASGVRFHDAGRPVSTVAIVSGSGGSMLQEAYAAGCDTLFTGEAKYDAYLTAAELGMNLVEAGHFATENVVIDVLNKLITDKVEGVETYISKAHRQLPDYL